MNDNDIICKQLDKYYTVFAENTYLAVLDNQTYNKVLNIATFNEEFYRIFGDFTTDNGDNSITILNTWFEREKNTLLKELNIFLLTIDGSISITELLKKGIDTLLKDNISENYINNNIKIYYYDNILKTRISEYLVKVDRDIGILKLIKDFDKEFSETLPHFNIMYDMYNIPKKYYFDNLLTFRIDDFLKNLNYKIDYIFLNLLLLNNFSDELPYFEAKIKLKFTDYYCSRVVVPILVEYIESIQLNIDSSTLIYDLTFKLGLNGKFYSDFAINYINKWYSNTITGVKMQDLLSQLVITPIKNDWRVTWVGHGKVDRDTILKQFKNENGYQHIFLTGMYDEWYAEEIVKASQRFALSNT